MSEPVTRFERRRRKVKISRRELVQFRCGPELADRLVVFEQDLISQVLTSDPLCAEFLEWYGDEAKKFGVAIRPGLAAFYWKAAHVLDNNTVALTPESFAAIRDEAADALRPMLLDEEFFTGRYFIQELIWWSAGDWVLQRHLIEAINDFREYAKAGKMRNWRRRKRRRLQAARRKLIKQLYYNTARRPVLRPTYGAADGAAGGDDEDAV